MKAVTYTRYGPPEVLNVSEVETPVPQDNEVRVRIHAAALTATDPVMRKGKPFIARSATGFVRPKRPIPGDVFAGVVDSTGPGVTRFRPGDEVYGTDGSRWGAHAEYKCIAEVGAIALKPTAFSFEEAVVMCDGALTALPFLRDAGRIQEGHAVLINGASGSVGSFAVQLAKYYGATVTGVCSTANVGMVRSLGADEVIDYTKSDFTKAANAYDLIFDTVGKSSFAACKGALKEEGRYLTTVLGIRIVSNVVRTSFAGTRKAAIMFAGARPAADKRGDLEFLAGIADEGRIRSLIDRRYSLSEIHEAHRYVETGHKKAGVVIRVMEA